VTSWRLDLLLLVTNAVYGTAYVAQREAAFVTEVPARAIYSSRA